MSVPYGTGRRTANTGLTEGSVRIIRNRAAQGVPVRVLATEFDIGLETVRRIIRHDTWAWVDTTSDEIAGQGQQSGLSIPDSIKRVQELAELPPTKDETWARLLADPEPARAAKKTLSPELYDRMVGLGADMRQIERGEKVNGVPIDPLDEGGKND